MLRAGLGNVCLLVAGRFPRPCGGRRADRLPRSLGRRAARPVRLRTSLGIAPWCTLAGPGGTVAMRRSLERWPDHPERCEPARRSIGAIVAPCTAVDWVDERSPLTVSVARSLSVPAKPNQSHRSRRSPRRTRRSALLAAPRYWFAGLFLSRRDRSRSARIPPTRRVRSCHSLGSHVMSPLYCSAAGIPP